MAEDLLKVSDLTIYYETDESVVKAVNQVGFTLKKGETLGLVGETGAGKTTTARGPAIIAGFRIWGRNAAGPE